MGDKLSTFSIAFDGDAGDIGSVLAALKSQVRSTVTELEATTKRVNLFEDLEKQTTAAAKAFADTKTQVQNLTAALKAAKESGSPTAAIEAGLKSLQSELKATERELNRNVDALTKEQAALTKAGVNTGNLAAEQARLAADTKLASAALVEQQSKLALNFKTLRDIQPEINRLNAAFVSLRDSGKLTFGELSTAQARLQQQIATLRAETSGLGQAFANARGSILAVTVAVAGLTTIVFQAARNWRDFAQQVAAIDSIADASKATIDKLAGGVRALAVAMGVDAVTSARALYQIISSGIPANNALEVLAQATKAAIAGLTDVDTAARVGVSVLNAYGLQVSDLGHVYDVLFQTVKDGVITFEELAKNLGIILPAAVAAKVKIEELGAAFVVLTRGGIEAPEAATAINRAIIDLAAPAPEAAEKLRELDIRLGDFANTIEQLASRRLTLPQIQQLIPDQRASRAVLALTQNFRLLRDEIGEMNKQAAQTEAAYLKLADTPQQQVAKFNAAWKELTLSLGAFVTGSGGVVTSLTSLVNAFNALTPATKNAVFEITALVVVGGTLTFLARQLIVPLNLLAGALLNVGRGGAVAASGMTAAALAARTLGLGIAFVTGFELGAWARDAFAPIARLGDVLGVVAGTFTNLGTYMATAFFAAITGNRKAWDEAGAAAQRNSRVLSQDMAAALSGATGRLRELNAEQDALRAKLGTSSAAAAEAAGRIQAAVSKIAANVDNELRGVDQIVAKLQASLTSLSAGLAQVVAQTQAAATAALAALSAQTQTKLGELAATQQKEIATIRATTRIYADDAAERVKILAQFQADVLKAFDAEAAARLEIAKRTGENVKRVELNIAIERRATIQTLVDATRAAADQSLALWNAHLANIKALDLQRVAVVEDVEAKIRELGRETLTARRAYADRISEIEENLSKGRQALAKGDTVAAERYAQAAIAAASGVGKQVEENGRIVVSQTEAQRTAIGLLRQAREVELGVIDKKKAAEAEGAAAAKRAYQDERDLLRELVAKLDEASVRVKEGLALQITANTDAVTATIDELDKAITKRDRLMVIRADITEALVEAKRLQDELEAGITASVQKRTDAIAAALAKISEARPEVNLFIKPALDAIEEVRAKAAEIVTVRVQIDSNAKAVQAEIDKLKTPTSSTHTVYVQTVELPPGASPPASAPRSPAEPAAAPGFAAGGAVFREPPWSKVPGYGSGDTVPARLPIGSFVVRKAASERAGDSLMGKLARGFALGGLVGALAAPAFASGGHVVASRILSSGSAAQRLLGIPDVNKLPQGVQDAIAEEANLRALKLLAEDKLGAIIEKARGLHTAKSGYKGVGEYVRDTLAKIQASRDAKEINDLLNLILVDYNGFEPAMTAAAKLGVPLVMPFAFSVWPGSPPATPQQGSGGNFYAGPAGDRPRVPDWAPQAWASLNPSGPGLVGGGGSGLVGGGGGGGGFPDAGSAGGLSFYGLAQGGSVGDTVPAWLTPGEWVIRPRAVAAISRMFGGGFLHALNSMQVPQGFALGGPVLPKPLALAAGGPVPSGSMPWPATAPAAQGEGVKIYVSTNEPLSEEYVRRVLLPLVNKINTRSR